MVISNIFHFGKYFLGVARVLDYLLLTKFKYAWNTLKFFYVKKC
jgi:hypothetical protein